MMVPLTNSDKVAIVDDGWEEDVLGNGQKWHLNPLGYAQSTATTGFPEHRQIHLHQLIIGVKPNFEIDHINGNRLDNRTENLRHVTRSQQHMNSKTPINNRSGRKGVSYDCESSMWRAAIKLNRRARYLGSFATFEEACAARKKAEQELHGEYARKEQK